MARLRTVSCRSRGWTRRRAGRGFVYLDTDGTRLPADDTERIRALAIPPAWVDVWICPYANGHLQAVGTDAAGRRQYLYHPDWRAARDQLKFERIAAAAVKLPRLRRQVVTDLRRADMPLSRATATAVRLLDLGYFRIGSDVYTDDNGSFGLTTLERRHLRRKGDVVVFDFVGKSGVAHHIEIDDPDAIAALDRMRRRRSRSRRLLAYRAGNRWVDLDAEAVNAYLADAVGGELTAKDFRTWHATVLAAVALAESSEPGDTAASRRRAVKAAVDEVAAYLGNTATIARASYIDPRVIDRYDAGVTLRLPASRRSAPGRRQADLERALLALLDAG